MDTNGAVCDGPFASAARSQPARRTRSRRWVPGPGGDDPGGRGTTRR